MTLDKYRENWDGAHLPLHEFAEAATEVSDERYFAAQARNYLHYRRIFEQALKRVNVEIG